MNNREMKSRAAFQFLLSAASQQVGDKDVSKILQTALLAVLKDRPSSWHREGERYQQWRCWIELRRGRSDRAWTGKRIFKGE